MKRVRVTGLVVTILAALGLGLAIGWYFGWLWAAIASPLLLLAVGFAVQATGALSRGEEDRP